MILNYFLIFNFGKHLYNNHLFNILTVYFKDCLKMIKM